MQKQNIWDLKRKLRRRQLSITPEIWSFLCKKQEPYQKFISLFLQKYPPLSLFPSSYWPPQKQLFSVRTLLCSRRMVCHPKPWTWLDFWWLLYLVSQETKLTFRHRASCILGQAFHYSPENAFYIFNQQIYFIIWYFLDRASLI